MPSSRVGVRRARRSRPAGAMNQAFMGADGKNCLVLAVLQCCHGARTGGIETCLLHTFLVLSLTLQ